MAPRRPADVLRLVIADVRRNRGRRVRHAVVWRTRRLRDRVLRRPLEEPGLRLYAVAFGPNGERMMANLQKALPRHGVDYMIGAAPRRESRLIHIDDANVSAFCECVRQTCGDIDVEIRVRGRWRAPLSPRTVKMLLTADRPFEMLIVESDLRFEAVAVSPAVYRGEVGDTDFNHESTEVDDSVTGDRTAIGVDDRAGRDQAREGGVRVVGDDETIWNRTTIEGSRRHKQCSRIEVARWMSFEGPGGARYRESDRTSPLVARLREATFDRFMSESRDFDQDLAAPVSPAFEVDVVYTWVDGDDEVWRAEKERYAASLGKRPSAGRVVREERFRNRDELKYSLRSVELFAPWVRRIHIVTADQCPPWLNVDHPRINLVSHRDIYSDHSWLPTFNSSGIETQLHHVRGLADRFLYFNDDFFLGQLCDPTDFFGSNGVLKYFPSSQRAYEGDIDQDSEEYIQADKNAIELLAREFPAVGREIMRHVPYASDRNLLAELEAKYSDQFAACASSRFRSARDLRPIAFMQYHYGYQHRLAMPAQISHRYLALWKPSIRAQLATVERGRVHKTFCINDVGLQPGRTADINQAVVEFLEAYFPRPSQFERT